MPSQSLVVESGTDRPRTGVLDTLRRHVLVVISAAVVGALSAVLVSIFLPTEYTADSEIYFRADSQFQPTGDGSGGADAKRFVADQTELVLTTDVLRRAGAALRPPATVPDIQASVSAVASSDTSKMTVTVVRPDPEQAAALANSVVSAYRASVAERVQTMANAAARGVDPGSEQDVRMRAAAYGDGVAVVEPAAAPTSASSPLLGQNAVLGGLVGLLLAAGLLVIRDQRRARRASIPELDMLVGGPLIGRFPVPSSRAIADMITVDPTSERFGAAIDVLTALDVVLEGKTAPSVLFLSWQRPLTTTSLVASVGLVAAQTRRAPVVVDGGLKDRGITAIADVDPGLGLEALVNPHTDIDGSMRIWHFEDNTSLQVVPLDGWMPSPNGAAARPQSLHVAADRLRTRSSLILIDGPPLTERSLGLALGRAVDGVVLVIDEKTSLDDAHEMGRRVALSGADVLGYVLVGPPARRQRSGALRSFRRHEAPLSIVGPGAHRR